MLQKIVQTLFTVLITGPILAESQDFTLMTCQPYWNSHISEIKILGSSHGFISSVHSENEDRSTTYQAASGRLVTDKLEGLVFEVSTENFAMSLKGVLLKGRFKAGLYQISDKGKLQVSDFYCMANGVRFGSSGTGESTAKAEDSADASAAKSCLYEKEIKTVREGRVERVSEFKTQTSFSDCNRRPSWTDNGCDVTQVSVSAEYACF